MISDPETSKFDLNYAELLTLLQQIESENYKLTEKLSVTQKELLGFKKLLTESDELSLILSLDGKVLFVSDSSQKIFGVKSIEILKNPDILINLVNQHDKEKLIDSINSKENTEQFNFLIINISNKKGVEKKFSVSIFPLFDEKGLACGKCILLKEAGDVFQSGEIINRYERIVSATPDLISLIDKNYIYRIVNTANLNFTGKTGDEIIGKSLPELVGNELFYSFFKEKLDKSLKGEIVKFENWIYFNNAGKRYMSITYSPYYDKNNEIKGIVATSRDITELKRVQEELIDSQNRLKELNAAKDKFFSIIAHDLRGPFTGLLGFTDLILSDIENLSKDEIKDYVTYLQSNIKETLDLLQNLLEWARTQTGRVKFEPTNFNICDLILDVVINLKKFSIPKAVDITIEMTDDIFVFADEEMCSSIIKNLLHNAIKFSNRNSCVNLNISEKNGLCYLYIQDSGVGIDEDRLKKLFSFSENTSTYGTENEKGTGLGLILCKELLKINTGEITCVSKIGKGTTFTVQLPKGH